jgi:hypothetical protein
MDFEDFDFNLIEDCNSCRENLQLKYDQRCKSLKRDGKIYIYPEQEKYARKILDAFKRNIFICTFIAPVQWGKTGVTISLIHQCVTDTNLFFNPKHIYVITGLNDNEWKIQTQRRMLKEFRTNVYHLSDLYSLNISDAEDSIIIIDECQIANSTHQTIRKMLVRNGINSLEDLKDRNIRIVQTSATPDNVLVDCIDYHSTEHFACIVDIKNNNKCSYKFFTDISDDNLKESMDLSIQTNIDELFRDILSFKKARWHIIRIPGNCKGENITIDNIIETSNKYNCDVKYHMIGTSIDDVLSPEEVIVKRPYSGKHTLIIVKNKWRASKSIPDKYIGVVHDRFTNVKVNYASEVQSLAGRMIGHGKMKQKIKPIIYCNKICIDEYINLFNNGFDFNNTPTWKKLNKKTYINKNLDNILN